ncbi:MAG: hypothetical protein ACREVJ_12755, partial [Gammaproteobacteria bacterium]
MVISYGNEREDDPTASAESIDKLGLGRAAECLLVEVTDLGGIAWVFWTYDHGASIFLLPQLFLRQLQPPMSGRRGIPPATVAPAGSNVALEQEC